MSRMTNPIKGMPGGSVSGCIAKMKRRGDVDDPGAYCAAIADRIEPGWREGNPVVATGFTLVDESDRNLDEIDERAKVFGKMWSDYLDSYGARYQIWWGVTEEGVVETTDDTGTYVTCLPSGFQIVIRASFGDRRPSPEESMAVGEQILRDSGLDDFLYYDGWESGTYESADPRDWPSSFWYEHPEPKGRLITYRGFEPHRYRPRVTKRATNPRNQRLARNLAEGGRC